MVPELARRLNLACSYLKELKENVKAPDQFMIDELEGMPLKENDDKSQCSN